MTEQANTRQMSKRQVVPDETGFFGAYGGQFLPPQLEAPFAEFTRAYHEIENDAAFIAELRYLRKHFQGRPTPVHHARTLEVDIEKQAPNVSRMQLLGATVVPVSRGLKTLKEAVDSAFEAYLADYQNSIYCIGSVVGPHPFPLMVRDFQRVVGIESREQFHEMTGNLPDVVEACVGGGGSNAIGIFSAFLDDPVRLIGIEPLGRGTAATTRRR